MMKEPARPPMEAGLDMSLESRIIWLVELRWLAVVGTLLAITVANVVLPGMLHVVELVSVTGAIGVYNILFHVLTQWLRHSSDPEKRQARYVRFAYLQIGLDLFSLTLLLHFAGGVENPFWSLYVLHVIIASILFSRKVAYLYAGFSAMLYLGMVLFEYLGWIPHYYLVGLVSPERFRRESFLVATAVAFCATVFFAALMATTLMMWLRERTRELAEVNEELQERARELAILNRRLEEADRNRKQFIQLVTHELRAPVAAIESYIKLILGGYVPPERHQEILRKAQQRARDQLDQIGDLLILGQSQRPPTRVTPVNLGEVLQEVLETMRGTIEERRHQLTVFVEPDLPPIMADRDQMAQIWMNLVSNAIKYTPPGGSIEVTLAARPTSIVGSVKDTGIGIAPEHQERIFEEFFRTPEAKEIEQHGTGLGLPIVKQIVESYGGRIWVSSSPGQGSKFTFALPKQRTRPISDASSLIGDMDDAIGG